jgi:Na+-driven multidrug efflux pump
VIHYGVLTLWGYIPLYFVFSVYNTLCGTINGAGKTFVSMVISIATMCAMRIVMLWIATSLEFGFLEFMCIVFPATWIVAMAAVMIYMWKADWMKQK